MNHLRPTVHRLPLNDLPELRLHDSPLRWRVEQELGVSLPDDYVQFVSYHNGAEGDVGNELLQLFRFEDLPAIRRQTAYDELLPCTIPFGSNGSSELFAFDTRTSPMPIVAMPNPDIDIDIEEAIVLGHSFEAFLRRLSSVGIFGQG